MEELLDRLSRDDIAILYKKFRTTDNYQSVIFRSSKSEVRVDIGAYKTKESALIAAISKIIKSQIDATQIS